jgi:hypothetical protein
MPVPNSLQSRKYRGCLGYFTGSQGETTPSFSSKVDKGGAKGAPLSHDETAIFWTKEEIFKVFLLFTEMIRIKFLQGL